MNQEKGLWMRICLRAGAITLILAIVARIWSYYENIHPAQLAPLFGITADALLRFTDTCLLFAIGIGIYQLVCANGKKE